MMLARSRRADLVAWCVVLCVACVGAESRAQDEGSLGADELAMARSLFAEALRDQDAKHFVDALQKFRRVRAVRDTAPVEYRMGACYDGLGQSVLAYEAYRKAAQLGHADAKNADVVAASLERLRALEKHVARLTLALPALAPADAEVSIDDRAVSRAALREAIVLDPGPHVVTAAARDVAPSRTEIVLPEGAQLSLTIPLEARSRARSAAPEALNAPVAASAIPAAAAPGRSPAPPSAAHGAGWIAVLGGGALVAASVVVLLLREGDVSKLNHACPAGVCPPGSSRSDLESTRSRALLEGPLSAALGAAGAVALGAGAYLLLASKDSPPEAQATGTTVAAFFAPCAAGIAVSGEFR